jgi:hypothetical protein
MALESLEVMDTVIAKPKILLEGPRPLVRFPPLGAELWDFQGR